MDVVKSRLIYTAGTFSIDSELAACRRLIITSSVLRFPPTVVYNNERSNPPKYFLGYAGLFINNYCEKILPLEFDPQAVLAYDNLAIQLYYTTICTGALITDNLVKLASVLTPPALLIPLTGDAAPFPGCVYTSIKFKLLFGTRLEVKAVGDPAISCDGVPVNASVPDLDPPPEKYPEDRPRSDDPARSEPEDDELPEDTAPATVDDPDLSLQPPGPCVTVIRGAGLDTNTCGSVGNFGDYSYNGYAELRPITFMGCSALRLFLDGVDFGNSQTYSSTAVVLSRTGNCVAP